MIYKLKTNDTFTKFVLSNLEIYTNLNNFKIYNSKKNISTILKSRSVVDSYLIKSSSFTNLIFKITNITPSQLDPNSMNKIESNRKIISVIEQINKRGGELTFVKFQNDIFENNLKLIDSSLPIILGEMIKLYFRTYQISINKLVKTLSEKNPLNYEKNIDYAFYENKIKRFLVDTSFGMSPSIAWNGIYDDTWGYLSIKENGEIQSYPGYLLKSYADYLFNNTKLETASSTRHAFGTIYKESDNYFIKLNLQIRFN